MKTMPRPADSAPGGMGGATRMQDPTEAAHDRVRRRAMNVAFILIALLNAAQLRWIGVHGWRQWFGVVLLVLAAAPLGVGVRVFELRFKMATEERRQMLREVPSRKKLEWVGYAVLVVAVFAIYSPLVTWAFAGVWLNDFLTYYHDRPERMRHLYAVTKTLDEVRRFRAPWAWTLPAWILAIIRVVTS
jgi:hypothetical protein